jgi:DNA processing protein
VTATSAALSDDTLATVLLCGGLGSAHSSSASLSQSEWNSLVRSLMRASWRPGDVLRWGAAAAKDALALDDAMTARLDDLLGQAVPIAVEVERLTRAGITILARGDDAYPSRWRSRLREQSPPLIFLAGSISLLERGGIAVVGSREVDEAGAAFARAVGRAAAHAGSVTISGGARGVDREAMFGGLEGGGEAVGIVPDGLTRTLRSPEVRTWVAEEQLVLVSPSRPDAGFKVWRAMDRNKLIYTLSDAAIVVSSDEGRGGTWAGAVETLKHDWTPLFVRDGVDIPSGNRRLIELGALPLSADDLGSNATSDFLEQLLERAERESVRTVEQPAQQSFLGAGNRNGAASPSSAPSGTLPTHDAPANMEPDPRQMPLLADG